MRSGPQVSYVNSWNYRASKPSPHFSRSLWDCSKSLGLFNHWLNIPTPALFAYTFEGLLDPDDGATLEFPSHSPLFSLVVTTDAVLADISVSYTFTNYEDVFQLKPTEQIENGIVSFWSFLMPLAQDEEKFRALLYAGLPTNPTPMIKGYSLGYVEPPFPLISKVVISFDELQSEEPIPFRYCIAALGV
jgi:hypothetical protein